MDTEEDGRWLSYAELAETRGIDRQSARRLASRQRWRRQKDNTGIVRVLVPDYPPTIHARAQRTRPVSADMTADKSSVSADTSMVTSADMSMVIRPLETAIEALREQLDRERERANRWEAEAAALRQANVDRGTRGFWARLLAACRNSFLSAAPPIEAQIISSPADKSLDLRR